MSSPNWKNPFKISPSLSGTLQPLVYLAGLDTVSNAVHRGISDMLNLKNTTKDFQPVYTNVSLDFKFPTKKQKNENIETYIPNGILKTNWAGKHTQHVPSVVVVFFDMNWSDPNWVDRKLSCAKRVKELKAELAPHGTQVLVMLIKASGQNDDNFSTERASALCGAADIPPKFLFVLSNTSNDRIQACIQRLESGMRELSKTYYSARIRRVKNWKDKATQTPLLVRYNFKIAFFQEIRRDYVAAMSHYQGATDSVLSIKVSDANIQELKVVASIINYRICRLCLLKSDQKESKAQFDKHIRTFNKLEGNAELAFENFAWLENQYHQFGDLLKQYYRVGASQIADPVTYFMKAATYAQKRQKYCADIFNGQDISWPDELADYKIPSELKYFGQRPWRDSSFGTETAYISENPNSIQALKHTESTIDHSELIIGHYGMASDFCRETQRLRTRCQLMCFMGHEFYSAKQYSKCIMLMTHVLREFGQEKWTNLIFDVAECGLKASCCEGDIPAYINFLIILLKLDLSNFVKIERQQLLWSKFKSILEGRVPLAEQECETNVENWEKNLAQPFTSYVGVHQNCIIDAQIYFNNSVVRVATEATVHFMLTNRGQYPIHVRKYGVRTSVNDYNSSNETDICLQPGEMQELVLTITPIARDLSKHIQLQVGYIDIGTESASVILHYSLMMQGDMYLWSTWAKDKSRYTSARIDPTKTLLQIKIARQEPMLIGEWHKVSLTLTNDSKVEYKRLVSTFLIGGANLSHVTCTLNPLTTVTYGQLSHTFELKKLGPSESSTLVIYVKNKNDEEKELKILARSKYMDPNNQVLTAERMELMNVGPPFNVSHVLTNLQGDSIDQPPEKGEFCVEVKIENIAPCPLVLQHCFFKANDNILKMKTNKKLELENLVLNSGEILFLTETMCSSVPNVDCIGNLTVKWARNEEENEVLTTSEYPLYAKEGGNVPLHLEANYSDNGRGFLKQPMHARYVILNRTQYVFDLVVSMDSTESFMTSGPKKMNIKLNGFDSFEFKYVIFPLITGLITAPRLNIEPAPNCEKINGAPVISVTRDIPKTIMVTR